MDLGAVIQDSHSRVDVEMITEEADANALYDEATSNLKYRAPVIRPDSGRVQTAEKEQAAKEYYASVRTNARFTPSLPPTHACTQLTRLLFFPAGVTRMGRV